MAGTSPYTYSWNNGNTTQAITGLCTGTYTVTVTDSVSGTATATVTITQPAAISITTSATPATIVPGDSTQLNATGGGIYQWSPATGLSCTTCANPVATPTETTNYCVLVTDGSGCTNSACIKINVETPCGELFIPNAFSPNSDGANEMECVMGNCIQTCYFAIYSRWGEKVFETTDPKSVCWDGFHKGKLMNTAVFVYVVKATFTNGEKVTKKGNISLIR